MHKNLQNTLKKKPVISKKSIAALSDDNLRHLAFDSIAQANIITNSGNGKIIMVNSAACKMLGYSKKELLAQSRSTIFDIKEISFKKMLKQSTAEGKSVASVTVIKKSGKHFPCEITSAVFADKDGVEKAITTITDMSQSILKQKNIDTKKEKIVADDISLVKSKQKEIDTKKEKIVADNIALVKSKQKEIDTKKEKIVAADIAVAKSKQKDVDSKKEKIVADDIAVAKSKQKEVDSKKEKIVADNIALAKSKQKEVDTKKEKIVADNIILAEAKSETNLAENSEWIKNISKTSYDVMWDWDITTNEIYVGESIKEVFGYTVPNNSADFTDFISRLLPEEKDKVENKILQTIASGKKNWDDSFMFTRQDGSVASVSCRANIVRDREGKATRLIGALKDLSKLQKLEKKLGEQNLLLSENGGTFLQVANISFDVIWDWDLLTNVVIRGEGFEELLGYPLKDYKGNDSDWSDHIHPDDKEGVLTGLQEAIASSAMQWAKAFRIVRADGSIAKVFDRASIFRQADGKAYRMIGAIQDISRQNELEEKLDLEIAAKLEHEKNFRLIFNSSTDVLFDIDVEKNEVIFNAAYEKEFGYKILDKMTPEKNWAIHIHSDDKERVYQAYLKRIASVNTKWNYQYRFIRSDNSVANISSTSIILRNASGKINRLLGVMHNISKYSELEERLAQEIKLKEKQMTEAIEEAKETERSDIGKELHDNVNQLLSASKLYLDMAKRGGENSELYLSRSSEYTLDAIEEIRKLTKGLANDNIKNLGICDAIDKIARDIMEINPVKITCKLDSVIENIVNDKFKLNLFRMVQEQLNNILKHAKATEVTIRLSQNNSSALLSISDNGCGFDTSKKQKGIGLVNIKSRAASYNGTADIISQPDQGCVLKVTFPLTDTVK